MATGVSTTTANYVDWTASARDFVYFTTSATDTTYSRGCIYSRRSCTRSTTGYARHIFNTTSTGAAIYICSTSRRAALDFYGQDSGVQ